MRGLTYPPRIDARDRKRCLRGRRVDACPPSSSTPMASTPTTGSHGLLVPSLRAGPEPDLPAHSRRPSTRHGRGCVTPVGRHPASAPPLPWPKYLRALLVKRPEDECRQRSPARRQWLFPGQHPGRPHECHGACQAALRTIGVHPRDRPPCCPCSSGPPRLPPVIIADLLGVSPKTACRLVRGGGSKPGCLITLAHR